MYLQWIKIQVKGKYKYLHQKHQELHLELLTS